MPTATIDKELVAAIAAAKSKEHYFAIVAKGAAVVHLFISKTPIKTGEIEKAKKEHGGNAVLRGKCKGQDGELVFRVAKVPTVQDKKLKEFIANTVKLMVKPRFELVTDSSIEDGELSETETEEGGATEATEPESDDTSTTATAKTSDSPKAAQPAAPAGDAAAFMARLKGLKAGIDAVRAAETSVSAEVKTRAAEVSALAAKKEFAEATNVLDRIEALLKTGLAELSAKNKPAEKAPAKEAEKTDGPNPATAFTNRFKALKPEIDKAIQASTPQSATLKNLSGEMAGAVKKSDFAAAGRALDQMEELLKSGGGEQKPAVKEEPTTDNEAFQKAWTAGLSTLEDALDTVSDQLAEFGGALMESGEENLIWIAENGLSQLLASLRDAASAVDRATSKTPAKVVDKAKPALAELKKQLQTPRVKACDENKVDVDVSISETIGKAIHELETALAMVKA